MIDVGFFREDKQYRLIISGHAGYAPEGQDIVCAAISALLCTLVGYLPTVKKCRYRICRMQKGYAEIVCSFEGEEALKMVCIGALQVSEQYPMYVRLHNHIWKSRFGANIAGQAAPGLKISGDKKRSMHTWKKIFSWFPPTWRRTSGI